MEDLDRALADEWVDGVIRASLSRWGGGPEREGTALGLVIRVHRRAAHLRPGRAGATGSPAGRDPEEAPGGLCRVEAVLAGGRRGRGRGGGNGRRPRGPRVARTTYSRRCCRRGTGPWLAAGSWEQESRRSARVHRTEDGGAWPRMEMRAGGPRRGGFITTPWSKPLGCWSGARGLWTGGGPVLQAAAL